MTGLKKAMDKYYDNLAANGRNTCDTGTWTINNAQNDANHARSLRKSSLFGLLRHRAVAHSGH
ncbi:MAG: hypothetical protein PHS63_02960 [Desulfoplanes sp.]|nr:hypothetical protein [Desulfoplanes sp.]